MTTATAVTDRDKLIFIQSLFITNHVVCEHWEWLHNHSDIYPNPPSLLTMLEIREHLLTRGLIRESREKSCRVCGPGKPHVSYELTVAGNTWLDGYNFGARGIVGYDPS